MDGFPVIPGFSMEDADGVVDKAAETLQVIRMCVDAQFFPQFPNCSVSYGIFVNDMTGCRHVPLPRVGIFCKCSLLEQDAYRVQFQHPDMRRGMKFSVRMGKVTVYKVRGHVCVFVKQWQEFRYHDNIPYSGFW